MREYTTHASQSTTQWPRKVHLALLVSSIMSDLPDFKEQVQTRSKNNHWATNVFQYAAESSLCKFSVNHCSHSVHGPPHGVTRMAVGVYFLKPEHCNSISLWSFYDQYQISKSGFRLLGGEKNRLSSDIFVYIRIFNARVTITSCAPYLYPTIQVWLACTFNSICSVYQIALVDHHLLFLVAGNYSWTLWLSHHDRVKTSSWI